MEDDPDWPNIIEEIESVGSEQLHAVVSLLRQALIQMWKAEAWPPLSSEVSHRQSEVRRFRADAADRYTPSMRRRIDLDRIYRQARHVCRTRSVDYRRCGWTRSVDELLC